MLAAVSLVMIATNSAWRNSEVARHSATIVCIDAHSGVAETTPTIPRAHRRES
jgi:hypothetical protein